MVNVDAQDGNDEIDQWADEIEIEDEMFGQPHLPSLLSMKCLKTTGPIVSSALRVLTLKDGMKIVDHDFDGECEGNDDDDDSNQVLNVSVHHGKPGALWVVTVLQERDGRHYHQYLVMIMNIIDTTHFL